MPRACAKNTERSSAVAPSRSNSLPCPPIATALSAPVERALAWLDGFALADGFAAGLGASVSRHRALLGRHNANRRDRDAFATATGDFRPAVSPSPHSTTPSLSP